MNSKPETIQLQHDTPTLPNAQLEHPTAGKETGRFFKIKLKRAGSPAEIWVAVKASSIGEAIVNADTRSIGSLFGICDNTITEITQREYYIILARAT